MPKFEGKLTDEEIRQIAAYVLSSRSRGAGGDPAAIRAMSRRLPLFPLPDVVLLPGTLLPLHVFEPRYRAMVADALEGDRTIGMAMLKPGWRRRPRRRRRSTRSDGAGEIVESEKLADGRYNILLEGRFRFRVLDEDAPSPYRVARVEELAAGAVPRARGARSARSRCRARPLRRRRPASSSCRRCRARPSRPSASPRRSRCACATRRRSSRPSSRRIRCRRASSPCRGRMLEWKSRLQFLAPFRPRTWTPGAIEAPRP